MSILIMCQGMWERPDKHNKEQGLVATRQTCKIKYKNTPRLYSLFEPWQCLLPAQKNFTKLAGLSGRASLVLCKTWRPHMPWL